MQRSKRSLPNSFGTGGIRRGPDKGEDEYVGKDAGFTHSTDGSMNTCPRRRGPGPLTKRHVVHVIRVAHMALVGPAREEAAHYFLQKNKIISIPF